MKSRVIAVTFLFVIGLFISTASAQEYRKTFNRELSADGINMTGIYNVNGNVHVIGYKGNKILISYEKIIKGRNDKEVSRGAKEVSLKTDNSDGSVLIYLTAPFIYVRREGNKINYNIHSENKDFQYTFNITIKVPETMELHVSTINGHNVTVKGVRGLLHVHNVNGSIQLSGVSGKTEAVTVNGNIVADYIKDPGAASSFRTVNGKIDLTMPKHFSGDIKYHIMNGHFYTSFDEVSSVPSKVNVKKRRTGNGILYKIGKNNVLRVGNGGPEYSAWVLNGNIFLRHN